MPGRLRQLPDAAHQSPGAPGQSRTRNPAARPVGGSLACRMHRPPRSARTHPGLTQDANPALRPVHPTCGRGRSKIGLPRCIPPDPLRLREPYK